MKLGICTNKDFDAVARAGYDYIETAFCLLVEQSADEFAAYKKSILDTGLKAETFNCFFRGDVALVGEKVDLKLIADFARKGMQRAAQLGGEVAVIGSGAARTIPDSCNRKQAVEQFVSVLDLCAGIAGEYGMKIVVEPLNAKETNFVNTVAEGLELARMVNNPNVGGLVDFYHAHLSGESLEAVETAGDALFHAHLARANADRDIPVTSQDLETCKRWAQALRTCGYDKRLSLECIHSRSFEESIIAARPAMELFL